MKIGVPMEIKSQENRVALTPAGSNALIGAGHTVYVEHNAGAGSGFSDEEYTATGAKIVPTHGDAFDVADMILKVKEPLASEYGLFKADQVLFTYLHLAPDVPQTDALLAAGVTGIAYETVQLDNGALPLLAPMSEVAGRMSVQIGASLLQKINNGRGILLGGVPGVEPGHVAVVGGGVVGTNAIKIAVGMGARVTVLDVSADRLRYLDDIFGNRIVTLLSNAYHLADAVADADLVIGAVLVPGAKAPVLDRKSTRLNSSHT